MVLTTQRSDSVVLPCQDAHICAPVTFVHYVETSEPIITQLIIDCTAASWF